MSIPMNESQRIAQLEQIRTPQNSNIIDEAIAAGKTALEIAHKIVKEENGALAAVDSIANGMNAGRHLYGAAALTINDRSEVDPVVDRIAAAMNKDRKGADAK